MGRYVIVLPEKNADFRVELIPGKVMLADGVSRCTTAAPSSLGFSLAGDILFTK